MTKREKLAIKIAIEKQWLAQQLPKLELMRQKYIFLSRVWNVGVEARAAGKSKESCPFLEDGEPQRAWLEGFYGINYAREDDVHLP